MFTSKKVNNILWFSEITKSDISKAGGKGANLGELTKAGIPVPPGFVITAQAYFAFLEESRLVGKIKKLLSGLNSEDTKKLNFAAKQIQAAILGAKLSPKLKAEIKNNYNKLVKDSGTEYVAVRSSATAEDLPDASFAGQQITLLNTHGANQVVKNVQLCWASLYEPRAIYYRVINKFDHMKVGIAVPVQAMIQSEVSGIMFTMDPVTNNKNVLIIEAGYGLGEAIVSGSITPDRYIVNKADFKIMDKEINSQPWKIAMVTDSISSSSRNEVSTSGIQKKLDSRFHGNDKDGGNQHISIPIDKQKLQKLPDELIIELAKIGAKIEDHYGSPQDTEWAVASNKRQATSDKDKSKSMLHVACCMLHDRCYRSYIVQSRPVTTMKKDVKVSEIDGKKIAAPTTEQPKTEDIILKGAAASVGMAGGPVKIIHSPGEIDKIEKGDVLVTEMTTPDYVPAMKKATAIITDTGGRTCFGKETKILTNKGFKTIKNIVDLSQKEKLFTPSLNRKKTKIEWKRIVGGFERKAKLIQITVSQTSRSKTNILEITPDHKMITIKNRELIDKTIEDILVQEKMIIVGGKIPVLPESQISKINKKLAYFMGGIFTDGSVYLTRTHGEVQFIQKNIAEKYAFIQEMKDCLRDCFNKTFSPVLKPVSVGYIRGEQVNGQATAFRCYSKNVATTIKQEQTNLSQNLLEADEKTLFSFLAGVIDGDGSYNPKAGRIHIFCSKEDLLEQIVIACLKLGIVPQIVNNRSIKNIQIVERIDEIFAYTKRVNGSWNRKKFGTKFFGANNLFADIKDLINFKGRIKPYIQKNLLLDRNKINNNILPMLHGTIKKKISEILNSSLRMQRVEKIKNLGLSSVYNIEVEDNHNYMVFTKQMTPVLVNNCHAAIVSREMGIPCVVGTGTATHELKTGQVVTVDGAKGLVYKGKFIQSTAVEPMSTRTQIITRQEAPITGTKVYVNLAEVELAEKIAREPVDGVGLLRAEFMVAAMGQHPRLFIKEVRQREFVQKLSEGMRTFASAFNPRPVIYRATDFKSNEYKNLKGGEEFEPKEENPMIGYRGCFRYLQEPDLFNLELEALKYVRAKYDLHNLHLMIPFVRTVSDLVNVRALCKKSGLLDSPDFKFWMMAEVPSNVVLIDQFIDCGIDGISIGSNDLTQLLLGVDRDNQKLASEFDERDPTVVECIKHLIKKCRARNVTCSICGQAPSTYPEYTEILVQAGITSISVNPDMILPARRLIASVERKIILNKMLR